MTPTTADPGTAVGPILLVEDDEVLCSILARHLRSHGYAVEVSPSAEAALATLRSGTRPSLVVLDINLPEQTGWAVAESAELRRAGSPPVLVASASHVSSTRFGGPGIAGYLPKPFPLETFMDVVERLTTEPRPDQEQPE
jgi:DNA-binding response OmpR family regulator